MMEFKLQTPLKLFFSLDTEEARKLGIKHRSALAYLKTAKDVFRILFLLFEISVSAGYVILYIIY